MKNIMIIIPNPALKNIYRDFYIKFMQFLLRH